MTWHHEKALRFSLLGCKNFLAVSIFNHNIGKGACVYWLGACTPPTTQMIEYRPICEESLGS